MLFRSILITRKILLILLITCGSILALFMLVKYNMHNISRFEPKISSLSWDEYRRNCGILAFLSNPREAWMKFGKEYQFLNVEWSGYIIKLTVNANSHEGAAEHSCIIFMKMVPDDFENSISLVVSFDLELYEVNKNALSKTKIGDKIKFNATLIGMGTDKELPHLHGLGIKILNENMQIPEGMTSYGRYAPTEPRP